MITKSKTVYLLTLTAIVTFISSDLLADNSLISKECQENNETLHISCNVRFLEARQIKSISVKIIEGDTEREYSQQPETEQEEPSPENSEQADTVINYTGYTLIPERKTLIHILIDTSNPRRQAVVAKKILAVKEILESANDNTYLSLAVFDDGLRELQASTNNKVTIIDALQNIQASGQITELYRSLLQTLAKIKTTPADRRFIMIFSDGNAEDTAYSQENILNAKNSVGIVSLGYPNSQTDRIHLQNLRQLSEETKGMYIEASVEDSMISSQTLISIIPALESGGIIDIDLSQNYTAGSAVTIKLETDRSEEIEFQITPMFDTWTYWKFKILSNQQLLGGLVVGLLLLLLLWILYRMKTRPEQSTQKVFAKIELLDSSESWYEIKAKKISIGRNQDNDLVIRNKTVSARHAVLQMDREGKWIIIDTNSTNGVVVNDELTKQAVLDDETIMELGDVRLRIHYGK